MAFQRLGQITIKNATLINQTGDETYSNNDSLNIYLDDSDNSVKVYLNATDKFDPAGTGTLQTGGNFMSKASYDSGAFIARSQYYAVCDGTSLVRYYNEGQQFWDSAFPYFTPKLDVNSPACSSIICNLSENNTLIVNPTSPTATDGSITVNVKSTNTSLPQLSFKDFEYGNGNNSIQVGGADSDGFYTYNYTFTGLSQGSYNIYVKEDNGCSLQLDTVALNGTVSNYGARLVGEFTDDGDTINGTYDNYRIVISEKDYVDASSEISVMGSSPLSISVGSGGNKYSPIKGSRIDFTIKSETNSQYTDVFFGSSTRQVGDKKLLIEVYQNDTIIKKGYFLSDGYSEPYKDAPYDVTVRFIDGLGDLSSKLFSRSVGLDSSLNVVLDCLRVINIPSMKLRVISGAYPSTDYDASGNLSVDASTTSLSNSYVDLSSYSGLTHRDVLEGVLQSFPEPMTIESIGDYYWLTPEIMDASSYNYADYNLDGTYDSSGTFLPQKLEGKIRGGGDTTFTGGTLNRDSVYRKIKVVEDRIVKGSIFKPFTEDNIIGEAISDEILGTMFLGYALQLNGDIGTTEVRKAELKKLRPDTKLITTETISGTIIRDGYDDQNGYDRWGFDGREETAFTTSVKKTDIAQAYRSEISDDYFLFFNMKDAQGGDANLRAQANVGSSTTDDFEFSFNYIININDAVRDENNQEAYPPYVKLKYQLYLDDSSGNTYYLNGADWQDTDTEITNEYFIDQYNTIENYSFSGKMPVDDDDCTLYLRVFDIDPYESDASSNSSLGQIDASIFEDGRRAIKRQTLDAGEFMAYYELSPAEASGEAGAVAANNSSSYWIPTNYLYLKALDQEPRSEYGVNNISFITKPNGEAFSSEFKEEQNSSLDNIYDLEYPVFHFNVRGSQTNEKAMILNYWKSSDGSPLAGWGSEADFSQALVLNELLAQYQNPSQKISTSLYYFSQVNATNIIKVSYDSNRLFKFNSYTWMPKKRIISGELVEIGVDGEVISIGEFDSGFDSSFSI